MYFNWKRFLNDAVRAVFPGASPHMQVTGHRARVVAMFFFCMAWMGGSGRLGLWLDHLLFPWFRKTHVRQPVFIVGNYRSGSTLLHRLLASQHGCTAMKTWEIYFAPSIAQRKFWRGLWIVDRFFGGSIRRRILAAQSRRLGSVEMHRVRLEEPEEDEALFLYLWDSAFNWFFMPRDAQSDPYWRFDEKVPVWRRRRIMKFYDGCLKRHLSLYPAGTVYVSKSPAFSAKLGSLLETFPDARVILLVRHPADTVVSTMGWFSYAWHYFAAPSQEFPFTETILEMIHHWYDLPRNRMAKLPAGQAAVVRYEDMVARPSAVIPDVLRRMGIPVTDFLLHELWKLEAGEPRERSHSLSVSDIGLTEDAVATRFSDVMAEYGYE